MITIAKLDGIVKNNQTGRIYQQGDQIDSNDVLVVVSGAVLINFDGKPMSFGVGDLIDAKAIIPPPTLETNVAPPQTPTPSELEAALAAGKDIAQLLPAAAAGGVTAAGTGGEEGGEGSNFVVVTQLAAQGLVESGYPTGPINFPAATEVATVGLPLVSTIDITPTPPEPPILPTVSVDLEVDPGMEMLVGNYTNADTIVVTISGSDGSSNDFTATINPNGTWNVDLTGVNFNQDIVYTATATATNTDGTATATDTDSYDIIEPPILPTVSVDIEVDPGAELLIGTYTNADTVVVTVTGSDGSTNTYSALLDNGNWSIDLNGVNFAENVVYTAYAVATNSDGTANATDVDSYDIIEPPILPTVSVDIEVDPGAELLIGTYTNADTVTIVVTGSDGSSNTYYASLDNGNWSVDLTGVTFAEDVIYTATATATNSDGIATATDIDSYDIIQPPILPTVSVDIEVDPGMEKLVGNYTNADTVVVTVTGSDGSTHLYNGVMDNGNWSVDLTGVSFAEDVTYTAYAVATNHDGTANATDSDLYTIIEPPILPTVSVDIEVDPGAEQLIGTYTNADTVVVTVTGSDGSTHLYNGVMDNGNWSVDLTGVYFTEDVTYTAYAVATNHDGTANATDVDSYDIQLLPTVSVDIEVDPGAEQLIGTYTDADTVVVTVTGSDGSTHLYNAVLDNGNWSVDLTGVSFAEDVIYTAYAVATNHDGTANATDIDSYDIIEPPPNVGGQWFISEADNHDQQTVPDKYMEEGGKEWDMNVVYQGSGSYFIHSGESVTVSLDFWQPEGTNQATFGQDYTLEISGKNQFVVSDWHIENNQLIVNIVLDGHFDKANLTGNIFDVKFTTLTDNAVEGNEVIGLDINTAFHTLADSSVVQLGTGWETNDDILINITDTTVNNTLSTQELLTNNVTEININSNLLTVEQLPQISYENQMNQLLGEMEPK